MVDDDDDDDVVTDEVMGILGMAPEEGVGVGFWEEVEGMGVGEDVVGWVIVGTALAAVSWIVLEGEGDLEALFRKLFIRSRMLVSMAFSLISPFTALVSRLVSFSCRTVVFIKMVLGSGFGVVVGALACDLDLDLAVPLDVKCCRSCLE